MDSLKTKCPVQQIYTQESAGTDLSDLVKENIPPKTMNNNLYHQSELSDGLQHFTKATPKKCKEVEDPLTPNTNIKLLTRLAATRDYANCTTPKSRKAPKKCTSVYYPDPNQETPAVIPRKDRSLSIICTRFLAMYPLYPGAEERHVIELPETCKQLSVERRRLYDIVNVFESINMLNKISKNLYMWFGKNRLMHSLRSIKAAAEKENILSKLQYVLDLEESRPGPKQSCILDEVADFLKHLENKSPSFSSETRECCRFPEMRKEKSLAFMSQKFLMLCLVSPSRIITMGAAAKVLNGFQRYDGGTQMKTHIRRLYDIANVLSSIGLINKEVAINQNGKRPAFKYIGPGLEDSYDERNSIQTTPKKMNSKSKSFARHSSFQDICNVAEIERRKLYFDETPNSAPPFQTNLIGKNENCATNFSNLDFNSKLGDTKTQITEEKEEKLLPSVTPCSQVKNYTGENDEPRKQPLQILSPSNVSSNKIENPVIPLQSNMTMINVPKGIFTQNNSCYILSPVTYEVKDTNQIGTYLLLTPGVPYKPLVENNTSKKESKEMQGQQNLCLKSSIDEPQPQNVSQAVPNELNLQHTLSQNLIIYADKPNENASPKQIIPSKVVAGNMERNDSSSICSTGNNSPTSSSSRFDSPFSIPSGYVTPVPNVSSDMSSFPSCVETTAILKNIESCMDTTDLAMKSEKTNYSIKRKTPILKALTPHIQHHSEQNKKGKEVLSWNSNFPLREMQNSSSLNSSCSNDSLNLEVCEILKGEKLGKSTKKHLLIDENTVLSPIKRIKKDVFPSNAIPSSVITSVPEKVFIINTANYQRAPINKISHPRPLRIKNSATKNNLFKS